MGKIEKIKINAIEKVIGQLVMLPLGIDFSVEEVERMLPGEPMLKVIINIDDSKMISISDNYDEDYARIFMEDDIEDKIYGALRYIGMQDNYVIVNFNHYNTTYINQLEKETESIINDYVLRASQKDREKYKFDVSINSSFRTPTLFLNIKTNLPYSKREELFKKLLDDYSYDDLVIEFE